MTLSASVALAELPHSSLGAVILVEDEDLTLESPGHVKVVEKEGKVALEGATSVVEASQALASWHLDHGQLDQAMKVVQAGLKQASKDESLLALAAAISLRRGEPQKALEYVGDKTKGGETELILYVRGRALEALGRSEEAATALSQALRVSPGNSDYALSLGNVSYALGRWDDAIEAFRSATDGGSGPFAAKCNLGLAQLQAGHLDEALRLYRTTLEPLRSTTPDAPPAPVIATAFANFGALLMRSESWEEAAAAYETALRLTPELGGVAYNHAYLLYRAGDRDAAYEEYRKALQIDPTLPLAHLHMGAIDVARGDAAAAARILESGSAHFDDALAHDAFALLGHAYRALADPGRAEKAYRSALERVPEDLSTRLSLASLLRSEGQLAQARSLLEEARKRSPEEIRLTLELAGLARAESNDSEEESLYRKALAQAGDGDETWLVQLNLAILLLRRGETAEARQRLEPLLERLTAPSDDRDPALSSQTASVLSTAYGMLVAKEGSIDEAKAQIENVARGNDSFPPAQETLAVIAAIEGDLEGARSSMTALVARLPEASRARASGNLGLILWLDGKSSEALEPLASAAQSFPEWLSVRVALADAQLRTEHFYDAVDEASASRKLCQSGDAAAGSPSDPSGKSLPLTLGAAPGANDALCARVEGVLGSALVGSAMRDLYRMRSEPAARKDLLARVETALSLKLSPVDRARALFARGTASLSGGAEGADEKARQDLTAALAANLDEPFRALAENNLGVALHHLGQVAEAEQHFAAARTGKDGAAAATLNMGITLDERNENGEALRLYQEYVAATGAPRKVEVQSWIEDIKRVYR